MGSFTVSRGLIGVILLMVLLAPLIATHQPRRTDLENSLAEPSAEHWLGTDLLGRDIYSRVVYGGRQTLIIAGGATFIAVVGGLLLGVLAMLWDGLTILIDALLAIPGLLIALVLVTVLDEGFVNVLIAVGFAGIAPFARSTHDALLVTRQQPYIESAISIGSTWQRILFHHLLRNALPHLLAFTAITFSWSLLNSAGLTFLGFGGDPSAPDWGVMLAAGRQTFAVAPWEALSAGVMLSLLVAAVNRLVP